MQTKQLKRRSRSYNQLLRATSILGSSQLINLALRLIRTKVIAILLGPAGVGLISIFQSVIDSVISFSKLGIGVGAVKEISYTKTRFKTWKLERTVLIFRRWFIATALLGCVVCASLAQPISRYWFNDTRYSSSIILLSIAVFFTIIASGRTSILQGLREITAIAKATIWESLVGLIATVGIYYYMGEEGIILAFIINSIIVFIFLNYYYRKIKLGKSTASVVRTVNLGTKALKLGIFITIGACINAGAMLVIKFLIDYYSYSTETNGLFQAAWTISNVFAAFIITSAGTDYFARLCSISKNNKESSNLINEQTYFVCLISTPAVIGIILFAYYLLNGIYTIEFEGAQNMLIWQMIGVFIKLIATPVASILLAKNKGMFYLFSEFIFFASYLMASYYLLFTHDIEGIGLAYLLAYCIYLLVVIVLGYLLAGNKYSWRTIVQVLSSSCLVILASIIAYYYSEYTISLGIALIVISSIYSIYSLNKVFSFRQIKGWFN